MLYIDENKINNILKNSFQAKSEEIDQILEKSKKLQRLSLEETAKLLSVEDPVLLDKLFKTATQIKEDTYGSRVVLFAPLYISNFCTNNCAYCSFKSDNKDLARKALSMDEIKEQVSWLLKRGHMRILMVAGEASPPGKTNIEYYKEALDAIYSVQEGPYHIKRVNVNVAPLTGEEFKTLKSSGIGTYQLFQESYHEETYRKYHPRGPKSDPDKRIQAIDEAFDTGIDDVGIGVLYGLYDYKFETLAMLMHIEHLEQKYNVGPHTISVPRIEPASGSELSTNIPYELSDQDFKKLVAVLRLAVPYTGIILSTRETAEMRNELVNLGVSQISAESKTDPGGYQADTDNKEMATQFSLSDHRSLDEVIESLLDQELIPSFCAACYRMNRTGENFMNLAKPGTIKKSCQLNALITLKEYLDDFASETTKAKGYKLIEKLKPQLSKEDQEHLEKIYQHIEDGVRDEYV